MMPIEDTPKIETAWLVESRFSHGDKCPRWWMGTSCPAPWTTDSQKAVRFCRKQDAESAAATIDGGHMVFASEHQWGFGYDGPRESEVEVVSKLVEILLAIGNVHINGRRVFDGLPLALLHSANEAISKARITE